MTGTITPRSAPDRNLEGRHRPLERRRSKCPTRSPRSAERCHVRGEPRRRQAHRRRPDREPQRGRTRTCRRTCSRPSSSTPSATRRFASSLDSGATGTTRPSTVRSRSRASRSPRPREARSQARPSITSVRTASASKLETTIDRTEFDIKWNMPLPNGEPALSNEVTLKAELPSSPRTHSNARPRDQRLLRTDSTRRPSFARCARRRRPTQIKIWDGLRDNPPVRQDDDAPRRRQRSRRSVTGPRRGRSLRRDTRVQLVRPRRAQERTRLGLPPDRRTHSATSRSR